VSTDNNEVESLLPEEKRQVTVILLDLEHTDLLHFRQAIEKQNDTHLWSETITAEQREILSCKYIRLTQKE